MRSDCYTKIVLTVIAIGLWALTMAQMGSPIGQAQAGIPVATQGQSSHEFTSPPPGTFPTRTGTSTLPLRWRVRHALLHDGASVGGADCFTIVSVRNFGSATTTVDVEWLDLNFDSVQLSSASLEAGRTRNFATYLSGDITNSAPFIADVWPAVANIWRGSAQVHSDDPRISATAFIRCDDQPADGNPSAITNIPADPVGATIAFFQAWMPTTWTQPVAVPE